MSSDDRRSVPALRKRLPRPLKTEEIRTAARLADALCASNMHPVAPPSGCAEFEAMLGVALAARSDVFDQVTDVIRRGTDAPDAAEWLRALSVEDPAAFEPLSSVLAGAYLMIPEIQAYVGYPGQGRNPAPPTQIADELEDGLLDPVIERGPIYRVP